MIELLWLCALKSSTASASIVCNYSFGTPAKAHVRTAMLKLTKLVSDSLAFLVTFKKLLTNSKCRAVWCGGQQWTLTREESCLVKREKNCLVDQAVPAKREQYRQAQIMEWDWMVKSKIIRFSSSHIQGKSNRLMID